MHQAYKNFGNVSLGRLFINKELLPRIIHRIPDTADVLFVGCHKYWDYSCLFNNPAKLCNFKTLDTNPGTGNPGEDGYYPTPDYNLSIETCDEIPDNSFDCIVMIGVYEYLNNKKQTFDQIYRMLKPGGIGVFTCVGEGYDPRPDNHLNPLLAWEQMGKLRIEEMHLTYEKQDAPPTAVHVVARKA